MRRPVRRRPVRTQIGSDAAAAASRPATAATPAAVAAAVVVDPTTLRPYGVIRPRYAEMIVGPRKSPTTPPKARNGPNGTAVFMSPF